MLRVLGVLVLVGCAGSKPAAPAASTPTSASTSTTPTATTTEPPANVKPAVVVEVPTEPFVAVVEGHRPPVVKWKVRSVTKNAITDVDRWLGEHPGAVQAPVEVPGLDLSAFDAGESDLTRMSMRAAVLDGDVLYVAHSHMTYAKESGGKNAYVTAIRVTDGVVLWRSRPLVANAQGLVLHGGVLFTGYGFTAEPDFLYALDAATGQELAKLPVKSGPEYLSLEGDALHVRTYDRDYVIDVSVTAAD